MATVGGKSAEPVHFKLYGACYHHGESTRSRHYTVDVLHPNGDSGSEEARPFKYSSLRFDDVLLVWCGIVKSIN
jgi:hypothetical protein